MTERAQALEAAREWQAIAYGDRPETWAALDYYRERGWPVDVNTFPERARVEDRLFSFMAGYQEARRLAVQPPPPVGSPTTDTRQDCTCLGTCRGAEGLGPRWKCALEKSTPVEPAGASEPPMIGQVRLCGAFHLGTGAVCELPLDHAENHRGSFSRGIAQWPYFDAHDQSPAPVSPVAPEPPTNPACKRCGHALLAHRPEFGVCDGSTRPCACPEFVSPTGAPAPCVWRDISTTQPAVDDIVLVYEEGHIGKALLDASGRWLDVEAGRDDAWFSVPPSHWMPFPTPPLTVER